MQSTSDHLSNTHWNANSPRGIGTPIEAPFLREKANDLADEERVSLCLTADRRHDGLLGGDVGRSVDVRRDIGLREALERDLDGRLPAELEECRGVTFVSIEIRVPKDGDERHPGFGDPCRDEPEHEH